MRNDKNVLKLEEIARKKVKERYDNFITPNNIGSLQKMADGEKVDSEFKKQFLRIEYAYKLAMTEDERKDYQKQLNEIEEEIKASSQ
jgi:hypothetical protein